MGDCSLAVSDVTVGAVWSTVTRMLAMELGLPSVELTTPCGTVTVYVLSVSPAKVNV